MAVLSFGLFQSLALPCKYSWGHFFPPSFGIENDLLNASLHPVLFSLGKLIHLQGSYFCFVCVLPLTRGSFPLPLELPMNFRSYL